MSLLAADELERERTTLDAQWRHRLERASYQAERSRRQFDATEPENRLVARTHERQWEQALVEQAQLEADYERFQRNQPRSLTAAEVAAIRELASDKPGLWSAATQEKRQTFVRLLLERVLVEVVNGTEQVKVTCHWHGGHRTRHQLVRPIARLDRLSTYNDLPARAAELRRAGRDYQTIAKPLNQEGWRPAKRRDTFNASMVRHLLHKTGLDMPRYQRTPVILERRPNEWTIAGLARHLPVPEPTLYSWVQKGRLPSRTVRVWGRQLALLYADEEAVATLRVVHRTPPPWRRLPPPITTASEPAQFGISGES